MRFLDPHLELEDAGGRFWKVTQEFSYAVGAPDGATVIHVPKNFLTDFASVPKLFWNILPPTGWYDRAAVLHDYLYQSGRIDALVIDQQYADDVLAESMRVLAAEEMLTYGARRSELVDWLERAIIYRGVRLGGFVAWNRSRRNA